MSEAKKKQSALTTTNSCKSDGIVKEDLNKQIEAWAAKLKG